MKTLISELGEAWGEALWTGFLMVICVMAIFGFYVAFSVILAELSPAKAAEHGIASVYSSREGHRTASGERMNNNALTAAHRRLPFGTKVLVQHGRRSVVVRITDRGPFVRRRVIDLTPAAAHAIGLAGLGAVTLEVLR